MSRVSAKNRRTRRPTKPVGKVSFADLVEESLPLMSPKVRAWLEQLLEGDREELKGAATGKKRAARTARSAV